MNTAEYWLRTIFQENEYPVVFGCIQYSRRTNTLWYSAAYNIPGERIPSGIRLHTIFQENEYPVVFGCVQYSRRTNTLWYSAAYNIPGERIPRGIRLRTIFQENEYPVVFSLHTVFQENEYPVVFGCIQYSRRTNTPRYSAAYNIPGERIPCGIRAIIDLSYC